MRAIICDRDWIERVSSSRDCVKVVISEGGSLLIAYHLWISTACAAWWDGASINRELWCRLLFFYSQIIKWKNKLNFKCSKTILHRLQTNDESAQTRNIRHPCSARVPFCHVTSVFLLFSTVFRHVVNNPSFQLHRLWFDQWSVCHMTWIVACRICSKWHWQ